MRNFILQNVPREWEVSRIGYYFMERKEKVSDLEYSPLSVTYDGVVPQLSHVAQSEDRDNRKKVCVGDLVINSRSDRKGASGISDHDGSVSLINIVLQSRIGYSRFFHYLMRSKTFQEEFYRRGRGIVDDLWTTRFSDLKAIEFALPPPEKQREIVEYLDAFCGRIKKLRKSREKQIRLLREKEYITTLGFDRDKNTLQSSDPRMPWLPFFPKYWDVKRAKYILENVSRVPLDEDEVVTAFRDGEVTLRKNRRETGYTFAEKEVGYQHIEPGDLVVHTMDAFAGAVGVSDSDGKSTGEYAVCVARETGFDLGFYAQVLRYMAQVGYIFILCPSVRERAPRFRFSKLAPVFLPVPPATEQQQIAEFVSQSRLARSSLNKSITALKEYEQSIVDSVVLGRVEVASLPGGKNSEVGLAHFDAHLAVIEERA